MAGEKENLFGSLIRMYRHRHGISREELAQRIGLSQASIVRLEQGRVVPSKGTLASLSQILLEDSSLSKSDINKIILRRNDFDPFIDGKHDSYLRLKKYHLDKDFDDQDNWFSALLGLCCAKSVTSGVPLSPDAIIPQAL
ncbi:helix-turn-helix domain-containing protein [Antarctobacter heliothermus]|uniref:Helix-turn-helix domain-containing protein n=1 Tax=Antarctobacter heliothermus TaxID=74033 RepID=A0A239L1C5_9RHOB|nr:helix-turn-helix transcriptional regulator [Antarctobacter heliothermus]SNT24241.1 Helix-turn-helix domain-containing protein [Antarctobacter heliothermus]